MKAIRTLITRILPSKKKEAPAVYVLPAPKAHVPVLESFMDDEDDYRRSRYN